MNITKKTKEVYITSDNHEFNSLKEAKRHEWYLTQINENGDLPEFARNLQSAMSGDSEYFKQILYSHPQYPGPDGGEWYEAKSINLYDYVEQYIFIKSDDYDGGRTHIARVIDGDQFYLLPKNGIPSILHSTIKSISEHGINYKIKPIFI